MYKNSIMNGKYLLEVKSNCGRKRSGEREYIVDTCSENHTSRSQNTFNKTCATQRLTKKAHNMLALLFTLCTAKMLFFKISMESLGKFGLGLSMRQTSRDTLLTSTD